MVHADRFGGLGLVQTMEGDVMLEILSLFAGGAMRLLPELMAFFNKRTDNAHELRMMDKQLDLAKHKHAGEMAHTQLTGDFDVMLRQMDLHAEALRGQMQKTSIWIVDVLNFLVRPLTTYYFLLMYGLFKIGLLVVGYASQQEFWVVLLQVYDDQDRAALWGILGFWFVGRSFEKKQVQHSGQF